MDDQIFQAMLGTSMPADNSEQTSSMAGALRGQHDMGQFLSIAPGLQDAGQNMQKGALSQAKSIGDRRQQGLTRTRQDRLDKQALEQQAYKRGQNEDALDTAARMREEDIAREAADAETARQHALALQASKNASAQQVAAAKAQGVKDSANSMGATERRNAREAGASARRFPSLIEQVDATPDAFSASKDWTSYAPDWTPNLVTQGFKVAQNKLLSDEQQRVRNDVYNESYRIINTLAGAALAKNEEGRLEQFTPSPNDDARTVKNKLIGLQKMNDEYYESFSGYSDYIEPDWMEEEVIDDRGANPAQQMAVDNDAQREALAVLDAKIAAAEAAEANVTAPVNRGPRPGASGTTQALPRARAEVRGRNPRQ